MMNRSYLNKGIVIVLAGICFILAAVFTESVFDGLLWGFGGAAATRKQIPKERRITHFRPRRQWRKARSFWTSFLRQMKKAP